MTDTGNDDEQGIFKGTSPAVKWMRILVPAMLFILFGAHIYMDWDMKPAVHAPVKGAPIEKTIVVH